MVRLRTRNVALALYGVLLVLPTAVLGGLQWYEIVQSHQAQVLAVPQKADDAARRLMELVRERVERLVAVENERPITHYAPQLVEGSADAGGRTLLQSPLVRDPRPEGVLAWFAFDTLAGHAGGIDYFWGAPPNARTQPGVEDELCAAMQTFVAGRLFEPQPQVGDPAAAGAPVGAVQHVPLAALAVAHAREQDLSCPHGAMETWSDRPVPVLVTPLELALFVVDGTPRVVGTRRVHLRPDPDLQEDGDPCLAALAGGMHLVQGLVLDAPWLFERLPARVSRSVLDPTQRFVRADLQGSEPRRPEEYRKEIHLVDALGLEAHHDFGGDGHEFGVLGVAVDTGHLEERFRAQAWRFTGMAGMLALSLGTGLLLLLRSVNRDLEQARRTENFVAAVTHELRTPLSAIKLHGEMLLDGWAKDEATEREYYRRIVRETGRLSTLVERVLEKSRLHSGGPPPRPSDLNYLVEGLRAPLEDMGTVPGDLELDLQPDLPRVLLTSEALGSIVVNLVENARKYAPHDPARPGSEPIRVVTRAADGRVVLEVQDRGPGIPPEEKKRVFDAFYRVGNEATRTTRGTGLGLHLVALQSQAIGARISVHDRPGGGTLFRVTFRTEPTPRGA